MTICISLTKLVMVQMKLYAFLEMTDCQIKLASSTPKCIAVTLCVTLLMI